MADLSVLPCLVRILQMDLSQFSEVSFPILKVTELLCVSKQCSDTWQRLVEFGLMM